MYRFSRKNARNTLVPEKGTPGPGNYNIKSQFDDHWKAKTVGQRTLDPSNRESVLRGNIPGPGAYDPKRVLARRQGPATK